VCWIYRGDAAVHDAEAIRYRNKLLAEKCIVNFLGYRFVFRN
jgi:hypothetical protein